MSIFLDIEEEINIGVDVDGTLTNERLGEEIMFLTPEQIEKKYMQCTLKKGAEILRKKEFNVFAITGRRERYKQVTIDWFHKCGVHCVELVTVPNNFYPNGIYNLKKYLDFKLKEHIQRNIKYAFDDNIFVVDILQSNGINTFKVDKDFGYAFDKMINLHRYYRNKKKC